MFRVLFEDSENRLQGQWHARGELTTDAMGEEIIFLLSYFASQEQGIGRIHLLASSKHFDGDGGKQLGIGQLCSKQHTSDPAIFVGIIIHGFKGRRESY
jgi:hypothetical protein